MTAIDMVFIVWIACMLAYVAAELIVSAFKTNDYAVLRCLIVCGFLCVITLLAMDLLTGIHRSYAIIDSESHTYAITNVTLVKQGGDVIYIKELGQSYSNCTINVMGDNEFLIIQSTYRIVPPTWISQNTYTDFLGYIIRMPKGSGSSTN